MVNYQLWQPSKYHGLNLSGDLIDPMDYKNPNIRQDKKENKKTLTYKSMTLTEQNEKTVISNHERMKKFVINRNHP